MSGAYYNEFDPYTAQWLRNLIKAGHIAPGDVDERSIEDVSPDDLRGYTQCHFFAGIGVWSHALRRAGWADDRPVWTGSCPCQPFSSAGKGGGFADERHLWPAFHWLIQECRPARVLGEQVASAAVGPWIDLVQADLEGLDYAFGGIAFPAAGVGAPHIRDRFYWVADTFGDFGGREAEPADSGQPQAHRPSDRAGGRSGSLGGMADTDSERRRKTRQCRVSGERAQRSERDSWDSWLADSELQQRPNGQAGICNVDYAGRRVESATATSGLCGDLRPDALDGFWRDADWLFCRDGKWRPVEPGTFPLVDGAPARVGRLRAYGNGLCAEAATQFIIAYNTSTTGYHQFG